MRGPGVASPGRRQGEALRRHPISDRRAAEGRGREVRRQGRQHLRRRPRQGGAVRGHLRAIQDRCLGDGDDMLVGEVVVVRDPNKPRRKTRDQRRLD